jgi:acyl-[acyl-carrier-protein]-phospholipid O-acyltransferase/long-chain-fatty-acid--[acyl-carrier-protein] ligase
MTEAVLPQVATDARPTLWRDRAFWGMTATQFLGAFNDNIFKQLVLLIGVDYVRHFETPGDPYQTTAQAIFAIPFVLFSGIAGWLADRVSKRHIVIGAKLAEIVIMFCGMVAFLSGGMFSSTLIGSLFVVLFLMSTHSAFFGPSKYGILPELFHEHDLPAANGMIQMTTFLAIIFGMAVCGAAKHYLQEAGIGLWAVSACCMGIAVLGTLTSLLVRPTPVAEPGLKLAPASFGVDRNTLQMVKADRTILLVLLVSSLFWFLGGVVTSAVNTFGKLQMGYNDLTTSLLVATLGIGIAVGCVLAGQLSKGRVDFGLVQRSSWGIFVALAALAALPYLGLGRTPVGWLAGVLLIGLGVAAGLFAVPLQVYLQARPPADQKGRMIGTMNLFNWVAILLAAGAYWVCSWLFTLPAATAEGPPRSVISWTFAVLAALILPVALRFRPEDRSLE